ncbi:MAG TPA: Glu/Leu/Phe/Val dehydrogenase dimerization domain-containing protein [Segeticoccus sp.]|uniref:Glu/Leu/Phe/Val dehydrogenase dimerization domain-containing protein n=1 Tax=Segeticoccus sp. TaxID=2706531 RepID=UPI002D7F1E4A|nr:Glu/Leu/Phe/Val dehydrogenase dimerization domain-containing protein [Segeticoccus sp.]HET8599274.1 Glu/Leu/Phe/Val dehydrogenase dimerization domain-containing protein [Segeticoccus sp.]
MTVWNSLSKASAFGSDHEQVAYCHDRTTGLRAIIAIHSTALGPALGGTRFYPYESEEDALADVLRLSRGMSYKNALAGLDLGGGKAVIIGDPRTDKSEALLRAYGRFVESLGGRYITACDVGTYVADMDVVGRETRFATGRSEVNGGCGDSSVLTAYGVYQGMRACAQHLWGERSLKGRTVGVAGVGKVGRILTGHLVDDGAEVVVTDVNPAAVETLSAQYPQIEVVDDAETLVKSDLDVYAPCAMGGALDEATVEALNASVVCGAANNQLVVEGAEGTAAQLLARGITYAPDFLVNSGGVIQVSDELHGFHFERAKQRVTGIFDATLAVLERAAEQGLSPAVAADHLAEERMATVGNPARIWLPEGHRHAHT